MHWYKPDNEGNGQGQPRWPDISQVQVRIPPGLTRVAKWLTIPAVLIVLLIIFNVLKGIWTEWLWFSSLGFGSVYSKILVTKISIFFVAAFVFLVLFVGNILLAKRLGPKAGIPSVAAERLRNLRRVLIVVIVLGAILLSIIFGSIAQGNWETVLRFQNGQSFGVADPIFSKDVSFYLFSLPFQRFIQGWLLSALIITLILTFIFYAFNYSVRRLSLAFSRGGKAHLSVLLAGIMGIVAWRYFLDIYGLVYSERGTVFGAGYTDVHAELIALRILMAAAILLGIVVLFNIFRRGIRLPAYAFGGFIVAIIVVGIIYPAIVERFQVKPSQLAREEKYIEYNIEFTREAFALNRIEEQDFPAEEELSEEDISANPATINNIRLWDNRPLKDTYRQKQALRPYYDFHDIDIDRYNIDGEYRQVMLGARELYQENLDPKAKTWVNQRLIFTHGYGLALSPVTEVSEEGAPTLQIKDIPPTSDFERFQIESPEIYYGEKTNDYIIVNTNTEEFDYPMGEENIYTDYAADGGVSLSSFFRRLAYAWQIGDFNILISGEINSESRILYYRNVQERVKHIVPFLQIDDDPYLVITEKGRLVWIQDAYTWSDRYPYSEPLADGTNYIRNSIKAVIDAYDGSVTMYVVEPEDPVVQTYWAIFPDLFTPGEEMAEDIRAHLRYPQDLFMKQAEMYQRYHMRDVKVFYGKEDLWAVPEEIYRGTAQRMEPYYIIMRLPGEEREEFLLMLPFTPEKKKNTIAWLAARSDGDNYGKLLAYNLPKEKLIFGPMQVENRIEQDTAITEQFALWGRGGATVIRGNLLMIPMEDSFLYVEPIFLQGAGGGLPELKRVIVASGNRIAMEQTLAEALAAAFGEAEIMQAESMGAPTSGLEPLVVQFTDQSMGTVATWSWDFGDGQTSDEQNPSHTYQSAGSYTVSLTVTGPAGSDTETKTNYITVTIGADIADLVGQARQLYDDAQACLQAGDLGCYQEKIEAIAALLEQIEELLAE
jgi:uncharacterized membrane protein (UPF0182 family)